MTHGHAAGANKKASKTYRSWEAMKSRCNNPKHPHHNQYAKLGYCEKWETFEGFYSEMGERPQGTSLERVDNQIGYSKSNCIWADHQTQMRNRKSVVGSHAIREEILQLRASGLYLKDIAIKIGMNKSTVCNIIYRKDWIN
jgi:hypothetical protein